MENFETIVRITGSSGTIHEIKDYNYNGFKIKHNDRIGLEESILKSGLNFKTIIIMLQSNELDTRLYALEILKPCTQFYNFCKSKVQYYNNTPGRFADWRDVDYKRAIEALNKYYEYLNKNNVKYTE